MSKTIVSMLAVVVVIGAGSFYGGMKYGQQTGLASATQGNFGGSGAGISRGARRNGGMNGDAIMGEILSKDDTSITIKLRDGGSKIVFVSASTQVMKSTTGALSDLAAGDQVVSFGTANADGSVTAKTIQLRPKLPANQ